MKSIYMDERWGKLQQEKENGEAINYVFEKDEMKVIYPFIKRKAGTIDGIEYYDLVTPRGECGPWTENCEDTNKSDLINEFYKEFNKYCEDENIIAEYIRFSSWHNEASHFSKVYDMKIYGDVYCNDLTCDFFNNEYSSAKRRMVRKAKKNNIEIVFDEDRNSIDDFLNLYAFTQSKYELGDYYTFSKEFIQSYYEVFPEQTVVVKAMYEEKVISSAIILLGEDIAHYHFAANDPEYMSLQANSLLIYEASLYSANKGKKLFDLGGAKKDSPLEKSKKESVRNGKEFISKLGTRVCNEEIYDALVAKVGGPMKDYFPAYRR